MAAAARKRFLAHMTQLRVQGPMATRQVAMGATHVFGDVGAALKTGNVSRLLKALEAAIMALACQAQRAHPKRAQRTGRSQLGLEPLCESENVTEFADAA